MQEAVGSIGGQMGGLAEDWEHYIEKPILLDTNLPLKGAVKSLQYLNDKFRKPGICPINSSKPNPFDDYFFGTASQPKTKY